jgi:hypothetical protein
LFEIEEPSQRNGFEDTLKKIAVTKFVLRVCSKLEAVEKARYDNESFTVYNVGE